MTPGGSNCCNLLPRENERLCDVEQVVGPVLDRPRPQSASFGERPAREHRENPSLRHAAPAVKRAEEGTGNCGVGVRVATAADRLHERLLELEVLQAPEGVVQP